MAVNVKMGVDIGGFKQGIQEGQNILKGLNAEMKATDAEFKATGNAEQQLAAKTKNLNSQLQVQKGIADQAQKALKAMEEAGVKPTDAAYQKMYATMMNATAGMNNAQAALNGLTNEEQKTAKGAEELTGKLDGIGKKVSLQQVTSAINSITTGLENAARKAVQLGEELWNTIMDSASRADDTATMAEMYGIDLDTFQRMQKLVAGGMDTSVESMLSSQDKLKKGIGKGSKDVLSYLQELHVGLREGVLEDWTSWKQKDPVKLFWEAGQALMAMGDAYDKETAAQALFGKGWKELVPLFNTYHSLEEYNAALAEQTVNDEQTIRDLAALNDAVSKLESSWTTLKDELIGAIAPALTKAADALSGLLDNILEYLKTPEGQQALADMEKAVSGLFDDLSEIDPQQVVSGFVDVFNSVVGSLQWLVENKDTVAAALIGIVGAWGAMEIGSGVLTVIKLLNGLKDLGIIGGNAAAGAAGAGATGAGVSGAAQTVGTTTGTAMKVSLGKKIISAAPYALPFAMGVDSLVRGIEMQNEAAEIGAKALEEYKRQSEIYEGSKYQDLWDTLMRYKTPTGSPEDHTVMEDFAKHWVAWWADEVEDTTLNELTNAMTDEQFLSINDIMNRIANGDMFYGEEDRDALLGAVDDMIAQLTQMMENEKIPAKIDVTTTAEDIEKQIGTITLPITFVMNGINAWFGKSHANGLPYVPYDGYLALLHRGERVLTASANRSYTYNNNNYFGNVNLNNGQDIDALCNSIDRHNRAVQSGFGA